MAGDKLRVQRKSVLDLVRFELQTLQTRLGGQDKKKLDQHLEQLRSAESRLSAPAGAGGGAIAGYRPPTRDSVPKLGYTFKDQDNFPKIVQLQLDMAVAALATDQVAAGHPAAQPGQRRHRLPLAGGEHARTTP